MEQIESLSHLYWLLKTQFYYRHFFKTIGERSRILQPLRLKNVGLISIGRRVLIHKHGWLQTQKISSVNPELVIGDDCLIGNFCHITCVERVTIEEKVLLADGVFISDHGHEYQDVSRPVMQQGVSVGRPVTIGAGSWLGENVAVMSCTIGKNCVIGANSVVLQDVPDYCVAVGAPAKIVKRWNVETRQWEKPHSVK
jgi:acetyltransferase-like isoleucine patch superfamily enzyme